MKTTTPQISWHARAIFHPGASRPLDILPDRQGWGIDGEGSYLASSPRLGEFINEVSGCARMLNGGLINFLQQQARDLDPSSTETVAVVDDWLVRAEIRLAGGYAYIGVCWKGIPSGTPLVPSLEERPDNGLVWTSGGRGLPPIGSRVWARDYQRGATVVAHAQEHNHAFAAIILDDPPDRLCEPVEGMYNVPGLTNVMGREYEPIHDLMGIHVTPEVIETRGILPGDRIRLSPCMANKASRWVGFSAGGNVWAKHYPNTTDADVLGLINCLPADDRDRQAPHMAHWA